jgi:hypothetical protein
VAKWWVQDRTRWVVQEDADGIGYVLDQYYPGSTVPFRSHMRRWTVGPKFYPSDKVWADGWRTRVFGISWDDDTGEYIVVCKSGVGKELEYTEDEVIRICD